MIVRKKSFENIVEKEKMLVTSIISFSNDVFFPIKDQYNHFSNN